MDSHDTELNSLDDESSSLLNDYDSCYDKKSELTSDSNDFDDAEDTRSELKFDEGK